MLTSVLGDTQAVLDLARAGGSVSVPIGSPSVQVPTPFPSPADGGTCHLLPHGRPLQQPDGAGAPGLGQRVGHLSGRHPGGCAGGLEYLPELGVGAIWISPVRRTAQGCALDRPPVVEVTRVDLTGDLTT
jgi:hypothetical protein